MKYHIIRRIEASLISVITMLLGITPALTADESAPVAWWKFDEGQGAVAVDAVNPAFLIRNWGEEDVKLTLAGPADAIAPLSARPN